MAKKKFSIIHNLEPLSEEQRSSYLRDASEYFGLDPDMGALDLIWMSDDTSGLRKLTVYARRGATDLLREIHGISITSMEQLNIPNTSTFRATGVNKAGRQEVAIGSCNIEGLKGPRLVNAIMTSETRAGRRLTLKFVGGGLLDEAEVGDVVSNINVSGASLAQLSGSPTVVPPPPGAPSAATGKDITASVEAHKTLDAKETPGEKYMRENPTIKDFSLPDKQSQFEKDQQAMRDEASRQLREKSRPEKEFTGIEPVKEVAKTAAIPTTEAVITSVPAPITGLNEAVTIPAKKRGRPRKKKGEVTFGTPASEPVVPKQDPPTLCFDCGEILKDHQYINDKYICKPKVSEPPATVTREEGAVGTGSDSVPPLAEPVSTPVEIAPANENPVPAHAALDKAQFDSFRARLREYANVILPRKGGMLPSEGIGGAPNKLRAFALKFTGATNVEIMSIRQWEELFEFLDSSTDPKGLVAYINEAIGAK